MTHNESYLAIAHEIGLNLYQAATWEDNRAFWSINPLPSPDRIDVIGDGLNISPSIFYRGNAGIALFLGYLHQNTGDRKMRGLSVAALQHALDSASELPEYSFGFHSGRLGIAYTAAMLSEILHDDSLMIRGMSLLESLYGHEKKDTGLDVIAGAAGAIPALIRLFRISENSLLIEMAINLGNHLLEEAKKEPIGWSWETIASFNKRNLCGYGHGASGYGHALLELYSFTGDESYRFAAEQAFVYERQFYDSRRFNWLDLRNIELTSYLLSGRLEELRAKLKSGEGAPAFRSNYMSAWCHGAPGIGLVRLRAYEVLGTSIYEKEAKAALEATHHTFDLNHSNFSLCHGHLGNCELFLYGAKVLKDDSLRERVYDIADKSIEIYRKEGMWRNGSPDLHWDPSMMLGDAGIGYFFLRLFNPAIPSVLLLTNESNHAEQKYNLPKHIEVRDDYINQYFGETIKRFSEMGLDVSDLYEVNPKERQYNEEVITNACNKLEVIVLETDSKLKPILQEVFCIEKTKYELTLELSDFSVEMMRDLMKECYDELQEDDIFYHWSPSTRLLKTTLNNSEHPTLYHILYRENNEIHHQQVNAFAAFLLNELKKPIRYATLWDRVIDEFPSQSKSNNTGMTLRQVVKKQLLQFYKAGVIEKRAEKIPDLYTSNVRIPDVESINVPMGH